MLSVETLSFLEQGTRFGDTDISASWDGDSRLKPADVSFRWPGGSTDAPGFAGYRLDPQSGVMTPHCDLICWRGLAVLLGMIEMLVFRARPSELLGRHVLHRSTDDDTGWYGVDLWETAGLLVLIYEGGIAAIDPAGSVIWHLSKNWDDVFVGATGPVLRFESESRGILRLDARSGEMSSGE